MIAVILSNDFSPNEERRCGWGKNPIKINALTDSAPLLAATHANVRPIEHSFCASKNVALDAPLPMGIPKPIDFNTILVILMQKIYFPAIF